MTDVPTPRACVIFRTHFWDAFVQRQFDRLLAQSAGTDVFVLVDETSGRVGGITHDNIVRMTEADCLAMGYAKAGEGNLLWFNGDYPLYRFAALQPGYDYYLQLEYDVVIEQPLAGFIAEAAQQGADYIGLTKGEAVPDWFWLKTCLAAYDLADIRHQLICLSLFSARALRHLAGRRLEQSRRYNAGELAAWPMCEGFIATEMARAGFVCRELSDFGDTARYDHWPPYLETDLQASRAKGFIHPVLDQERFIASMHKYHVGLLGYLNPNSLFHRKLRRLPRRRYAAALAESFARKTAARLRSALGQRARG